MISNLPRNAPDHDDNTPSGWGPKAPYNTHTQAKTLTCKGGDNYHPSGNRTFTIRELASLQTFPLYHTFAGARGITARKKQIGNAVPPVLARALFKTIVEVFEGVGWGFMTACYMGFGVAAAGGIEREAWDRVEGSDLPYFLEE